MGGGNVENQTRPHARIPVDYRSRQRDAADAGRKLERRGRPENLDLQSAQGRHVAQRRGADRRPQCLEHSALGSIRNDGSSNVGPVNLRGARRDTPEKDAKGKPIKRMSKGAVEVVDKYTIRLNLNKPVLSGPEDFYNYPTAIAHPSFKPPISDNMIGTGPFTLSELRVGDRCILKRVKKMADGKEFNYWGGKVYLDEIHYYNFDADNQLSAFASGDVDGIYEFSSSRSISPNRLPAKSKLRERRKRSPAACRWTQKPFSDKRVRRQSSKRSTMPQSGS